MEKKGIFLLGQLYSSYVTYKCSNDPETPFHRVRHENIHNFGKNLDQNGLLWKKLEHFEIGRPKFLRSKIFIEIFIENCMKMKKSKFFDFKIFVFSFKFQWKFLDGNFRKFSISRFLVGRFQNAPTFFVINRFGRDFFQSCVDFHGGHDGIEIREIWSVWMLLQKKSTFRDACPRIDVWGFSL